MVQLSEQHQRHACRPRPAATAASRACGRSTREWTSPINNHVLFEAVGLHLFERWGNMHYRVNDGSLDDPAIEDGAAAAATPSSSREGHTPV